MTTDIKISKKILLKRKTENKDNDDDVKEKEETICPTCLDPIDQDELIRLQCYHAFHYDCAVSWYKIANKDPKNIRSCPLCRKDGGYLPLKIGEKPIKDIHYCEDEQIKSVAKNLNTMVYPWSNNQLTFYKCQAIIKSKKSPNYGKECKNHIYNSGLYCGIHKYSH